GSKNLWGGTGLAVNSYSDPDYQRAAWMFITWATSPEVQKRLLLEGSTPTRTSVYEDPEVQAWIAEGTDPLVNMLPLVLEAWQPENIGLAQGKLTTWIQVDEVIFSNLSMMLTGNITPEEAMAKATAEINAINKWTPADA
ncbi:MAG: extracellular solute-binding protein, partial [Thermomicrobiales bacterium]|nr:extracellular solute-binding protein [Thermomicrobiales bacterium]